jgi:hypothetical protein
MYEWMKPIPKYKNRKCVVDGIEFDSRKEANRYTELKLMLKAGKIKDLRRQVKYVLIPTQRGDDKKVIERECAYIADFVYFDCETGKEIVEDVKGYRGGGAYEVFKIKRKLMLERYGIRIKES